MKRWCNGARAAFPADSCEGDLAQGRHQCWGGRRSRVVSEQHRERHGRNDDADFFHFFAELGEAFLKPPRHGPLIKAKLRCDFALAAALQVMKDHGGAQPFGEVRQRLIHPRGNVGPSSADCGTITIIDHGRLLAALAGGRTSKGVEGSGRGHNVQPYGKWYRDSARPAGEFHKAFLRDVFCVMWISDHSQARPIHHSRIATKQSRERIGIIGSGILPQEDDIIRHLLSFPAHIFMVFPYSLRTPNEKHAYKMRFFLPQPMRLRHKSRSPEKFRRKSSMVDECAH